MPRRLVRRALRELKAEHRRAVRRHAEEARTSVVVRCRDAVWAMDATHLVRDAAGRAVLAEGVRDVASGRTVALSVGPAATAEEVVGLLELAVAERGGAPLVLVVDNGGPYRSRRLARWCAEHGVVLLHNEPRTPQHNATAEHGFGELKGDACVRAWPRGTPCAAALVALLDSLGRLDHGRLRATRGWYTAVEADVLLPSWRVRVTRERFYATARCAVAEAVLHSGPGRARRRAERGAILGALEECDIITRTRGGAPSRRSFAEDVS